MDWIETDGTVLRYELRQGRGGGDATLVLVHEMGGTLESWDEVLPGLSPSRAVLRYDTRGAGLSGKLRGTVTMSEMAQDVAVLLDASGRSGPIVLAGIAVGAAIALSVAARRPRRVAGVLAFAPATGLEAERRVAMAARADAIERGGMPAIADAALAQSYPEGLRGDDRRYRRQRARWLGNDPASYAAILRMLVALDMSDDLAAVACPTLVLAGTCDLVRPPEAVRRVAGQIRHARFETLETGHFAAVQSPDALASRLNLFAEEVLA